MGVSCFGMAGLWDSIMKRLVKAYGAHFAKWLVTAAIFVQALDIELKPQHLFADALLEITVGGKRALIHIEFQTDRDPEMEVRLMEYNMLASHQYGRCPVTSYVIYLRKDGEVAKSPLIRKGAVDEEVHRFQFRVIKLWEVPAETIVQLGWVGLLPLLTLTKGGKRPEVVKVMIDSLVSAGEKDLLALAQLVGGLAFKKESERASFKRRFSMFQDILKESWVYQEIGHEFFEQGREQGREQGKLEGQRQTLMNFVQVRFPEIVAVAKQQTDATSDPEVLQALTIKLFAAQTVEEARRVLLEGNTH